MKLNPTRFFRLTFLLTTIAGLALVGTARVCASAEDEVDQALSASKSWVAQIDAGHYDDSYSFTCDEMRDKVPQDQWVEVLKAIRKPWGPAVDRKQISHVYKPNGVPGLNGECMVITYDTTFDKMNEGKEVIVLKWTNGQWRGAFYSAGPKQTDDGSASSTLPSTSSTETHTENHVRPEPH